MRMRDSVWLSISSTTRGKQSSRHDQLCTPDNVTGIHMRDTVAVTQKIGDSSPTVEVRGLV
jgi:hypothetical protein